MAHLRIGILETGGPPDTLAGAFSSYSEMVQTWLAPLGGHFEVWKTIDGSLPDHPSEADLWVITGSRLGVYDDIGWVSKLESFVRSCRDAGQPMVGICFGHQIIASALGGRVTKSPKGWGVGVHSYDPANWPEQILGTAPKKLGFPVFHQDQVIEKPAVAQTIAQSEFCEFAALWYPGFAVTVQGHPEFTLEYVTALLHRTTDNPLDDAGKQAGLATLDTAISSDELVGVIRAALLNGNTTKLERNA